MARGMRPITAVMLVAAAAVYAEVVEGEGGSDVDAAARGYAAARIEWCPACQRKKQKDNKIWGNFARFIDVYAKDYPALQVMAIPGAIPRIRWADAAGIVRATTPVAPRSDWDLMARVLAENGITPATPALGLPITFAAEGNSKCVRHRTATPGFTVVPGADRSCEDEVGKTREAICECVDGAAYNVDVRNERYPSTCEYVCEHNGRAPWTDEEAATAGEL